LKYTKSPFVEFEHPSIISLYIYCERSKTDLMETGNRKYPESGEAETGGKGTSDEGGFSITAAGAADI